ncbi:uncharacterized protein ASPGLDRAFT_86382 [Aspergillus glaucus CBS 516.65]|uniref:MACPF domain-containing protein n=1 Tax=Aspergillus glaucus CBS 516.65 TaxID=1160497 RepID=A0A1L9V451_ASPGL|nr:hypothetical protein ASPGLDRAFT_86382 [Aspergillus glaucus CBS 516.65]OJJ78671.1 hypothetical protein ASPGLDRAFT_86382 [Aspergillus glaucus CBS 516.65]
MGVTETPDQDTIEKGLRQSQKANENDTQAMFDIYIYDETSKAAKMEKFVNLGSIKNIEGKALKDIRKMLISQNALTYRQKGSSFCNKAGAQANEDLSFSEYTESLSRGVETSIDDKEEKKPSNEGDEAQAASASGTQGGKTGAKKEVFTVYLKSRRLPTEVDEATKEFMKQKLELELRQAELGATVKPELLTSSYNHNNFMASAGSGKVTHPADMTQKEWNIVMQTNSLLNGSYIRLPSAGVSKKVERAMYPAFQLKPRLFRDYEVSLDSKDIKTPEQMLRIPRYRVEDDSYVEVSENKSSVASAIASSSLSEIAAEVAVEGGAFGYSASAKASYKNEEKSANSMTSRTDENHMTITYNFPRVVVQLDEDSLELSEECAADLKHVKDKASVEAFRTKYGAFFASRVELGGRLHSSENSKALGSGSVEEKSKSMKVAASVSFSSPFVQAAASASYGNSSASKNENTSSSLNNSMTWEAKGGDTLLCNNPPAWCSTVASFYNWRVVKQENLLSIEELISRTDGHQGVKTLFDSILLPEGKKPEPPKVASGSLVVCFLGKDTSQYMTMREDTGPNTAIGQHVASEASTKMFNNFFSGGFYPPAQVTWLQRLMSKCCRPLVMREARFTGSQDFQVHGLINTTTGHKRLQNGATYKVWNKFANGWIKGTDSLPGFYDNSFLHEEGDMGAAYIKLQSVKPFEASDVLDQEDEVFIYMYDESGTLLGPVKELPNGMLGTDRSGGAKTFVLRFQ